jgi:hypothetical protein
MLLTKMSFKMLSLARVVPVGAPIAHASVLTRVGLSNMSLRSHAGSLIVFSARRCEIIILVFDSVVEGVVASTKCAPVFVLKIFCVSVSIAVLRQIFTCNSGCKTSSLEVFSVVL